ncbi:MAG: hypothetical protein ACYC6D_03965, partial [Melioribacteraceae bacterium]
MNKIFFKILFASYIVLLTSGLSAQQENVPIDHQVYAFIKEMSVKNILGYIHDDNPGMSRAEVTKNLELIAKRIDELTVTEKKLLKKFQYEFYDETADSTNTYQMFGSEAGFSKNGGDFLS